MEPIRVSAVQMESELGDLRQNGRQIIEWMEQARDDGAHLICFPEACLTGYSSAQAAKIAIAADDPTLLEIQAAARDLLRSPSPDQLPSSGRTSWRPLGGEEHLLNPITINLLQRAVRENSIGLFDEYSRSVHAPGRTIVLRDLLQFAKLALLDNGVYGDVQLFASLVQIVACAL